MMEEKQKRIKSKNPNGMGSYKRKKDGRFAWVQTKDGETREITAKSMPELQEKVKLVSDLPIIKGKYKTDDWFQKWLDTYVKPLKKPATYDQYKILYEKHVKPVIGSRQVKDLKKTDIQGVIAKMNENGLSTWTMKHARKIMHIAFEKAFDDRIISKNPVDKIEIPSKQSKPRKVLTPEELVKLFKSLENSRWIWAVKFDLVTALRRGELLALKWTDIDFINKRIKVDKSNSLSGVGDTKSAKVHYIPLSDKAVQYLNGQRNQLQKECNPIIYTSEADTGLVFPNNKGQMLKPKSFYKMLTRAAETVGIHATPHCLRHTFVYMTRHKLSLKELQYALCHDESTTTLDIYGDMINETTDTTAKTLDTVFDQMDAKMEEIRNQKPGKVIQFRKAK